MNGSEAYTAGNADAAGAVIRSVRGDIMMKCNGCYTGEDMPDCEWYKDGECELS